MYLHLGFFSYEQAVRVATQYASAPASWQYLRIYSPGGSAVSA